MLSKQEKKIKQNAILHNLQSISTSNLYSGKTVSNWFLLILKHLK